MDFTGTAIADALTRAAHRLVALRDRLNALDAAMGDGDSGLTAEKGATGLLEFLAANPPPADLGKWLAQAGMAYNRAAPSTMGALVATAFMRAGKEVQGKALLDAPDLARMLLAASQGIQERGKAQPGDKTILDALHPAAEAFSAAIAAGEGPEVAGQKALEAARRGRDAAIPLRSRVGRANWVGERTEGQPDPGTVLFVAALEAVLGAEPSEPGSTRA
ncbi:DAK2 domain-containing protein [Meiothermus granaticius]|uniref:PEP-dependent dihydroxyacetone kinase, ADP-binding subunit DhaL n=1 Tax=Meiothermus granaticius NBRC 107808 TaxID=1227551 RepID=A0A399F8P4_9DEIN|nr:DAK2 domain-containing protein [Meiothermus granaticius]RIH92608.1 PEP-dependent dihydroxyacetone kinase, ADP-binding subunit DhaL [Meiothermus granaticius NBRC 107808]GEM87974.1 dihydroxyacetone kinase subunit L [Meiothermus granaticius NBRC 107808]